jgi:7-cyano-7-deazaguanine synthase in queuosine biosynthesis
MERYRRRVGTDGSGRISFNTDVACRLASSVALNDAAIARAVGRPLKPEIADLIEVAAIIHLVDRLHRRPSANHAGDSWHRDLRISVGVRDPARWSDASVFEPLHELLAWLTDDTWDIEFTSRTAESRISESVQFLFETPLEGSTVALYSGGLDSLAGAALDVNAGITPVLVSAVANNRQNAAQRKTAEILGNQLGVPMPRVAVTFHLHGATARENSHRSRGFGFLALGAAVASITGLGRLRVYENGPGAINLPYTRAQTGSQATRSMHPESLRRVSALMSRLLDDTITIENPNQFLTKAEMCLDMPTEVHAAVPHALSCDMASSHRRTSTPSCGVCTSCLLRRQALRAAGLEALERQTPHRVDLFEHDDGLAADRYNLHAMLGQAAKLMTCADGHAPWRLLSERFPEVDAAANALALAGDASLESVRARLVDLFHRYAAEWALIALPGSAWYFPSASSQAA